MLFLLCLFVLKKAACFRDLRVHVRRAAACQGGVSWFCQLFGAVRHFR